MRVKHYADGREYEPVDVIRDWGLNFNLGNAIKYISRAGRKGNYRDTIDDITKAIDYLDDERAYIMMKHLEEISNAKH